MADSSSLVAEYIEIPNNPMEYLARTPYYQEFYVTFSGELGLEVQKIHEIPVVRKLLLQNSRFVGKASFPPDSNNIDNTLSTYQDRQKRLASA